MIPTPDLSHLTRAEYEHVYEPAEDTFLLLDALEQDAQDLMSLRPLICLEIGSGTGCVSCFAGSVIGPSAALYLCTDINPHATVCTLSTGKRNKIPLEPITVCLAQPFLSRLQHSVDVILFNPPYVPTIAAESSEAQASADIAGSWAGGLSGMQVTELFLSQVNILLSPRGRFYLIALKQNDVPGIRRTLSVEYGLNSQVIMQRRAGREHLFVLRCTR